MTSYWLLAMYILDTLLKLTVDRNLKAAIWLLVRGTKFIVAPLLSNTAAEANPSSFTN